MPPRTVIINAARDLNEQDPERRFLFSSNDAKMAYLGHLKKDIEGWKARGIGDFPPSGTAGLMRLWSEFEQQDEEDDRALPLLFVREGWMRWMGTQDIPQAAKDMFADTLENELFTPWGSRDFLHSWRPVITFNAGLSLDLTADDDEDDEPGGFNQDNFVDEEENGGEVTGSGPDEGRDGMVARNLDGGVLLSENQRGKLRSFTEDSDSENLRPAKRSTSESKSIDLQSRQASPSRKTRQSKIASASSSAARIASNSEDSLRHHAKISQLLTSGKLVIVDAPQLQPAPPKPVAKVAPRQFGIRLQLTPEEKLERERLRQEEGVSRGETKEMNPFHELIVLQDFKPLLDHAARLRKPPSPKPLLQLKELLIFRINQEVLVSCSPLDLDKKSPTGLGRWKNGIEIWAWVSVYDEAPHRDGSPESHPSENDGQVQIRIVGSDIKGMAVANTGLWLETKEALYLLYSPHEQYIHQFDLAKVFTRLHLYCSRHKIGQQGSGASLRARLLLGELDQTNPIASLELPDELSPEYLDSAAHGYFATQYIEVFDRLEAFLPLRRFVSPLVASYLINRPILQNLTFTVKDFDAKAAQSDRKSRQRVFDEIKVVFNEWDKSDGVEEPSPVGDPFSFELPGRGLPEDWKKIRGHGRNMTVDAFEAAQFENEIIRAGDCVLVAESYNGAHSTLAFARVVYFLRPPLRAGESQSPLYVHLSWFYHSQKTYLGLEANPNELFFAEWCAFAPAGCVIRKIPVVHLPLDTIESPVDKFFYWAFIDPTTSSFRDSSPYETPPGHPFHDCVICSRDAAEKKADSVVPLEDGNGFSYQGINYHQFDTVCIIPEELPSPFRLAQIKSIEWRGLSDLTVGVAWIFRYDQLNLRPNRDERLLVLSDITTTFSKSKCKEFRGHFHLDHLDHVLRPRTHKSPDLAKESFSQDPRAFYFAETLTTTRTTRLSKDDLDFLAEWGTPERLSEKLSDRDRRALLRAVDSIEACNKCVEDRLRVKMRGKDLDRARRDFKEQLSLPSMETYAGIGGLGIGLKAGCPTLKFTTMIETHQPVLAGLKANFPDAQIIGRPVSEVAQEAFELEQESGPVLFLSGGFPCQAFSHANKFQFVEDSRTVEPLVFVSMVHRLRPLLGVIENVRGLTSYKFPDLDDDGNQGSYLYLIVEILLRLGYQCSVRLLQAAAYGVPQDRVRLFIVFALRGLPLPEIPAPTHAYSQDKCVVTLELTGRERDSIGSDPTGYLPHLNLRDAITDLPRFEHQNPRLPKNPKRKEFNPLPSFPRQPIGFDHPVRYASPPQSSFQRSARLSRNSEGVQQTITNHQVRGHDFVDIPHRLTTVGIEGVDGKKGDYRDMDPEVRPVPPPWVRIGTKDQHNFCRRALDTEVPSTILTSLNMDGHSQSARIHPEQNRLFSVRETARIQGFPDCVDFTKIETSDPNDSIAEQYRAIGNAVPPPLAKAIGKEIDEILGNLTLKAAKPSEALTPHRARAEKYREQGLSLFRKGVVMEVDEAEEVDQDRKVVMDFCEVIDLTLDDESEEENAVDTEMDDVVFDSEDEVELVG